MRSTTFLYRRSSTTRSCISIYMYTVVVVPTDTASAGARLEQCITDVGRWMCANRLKLHADKTELLWVGSRHSLSLVPSKTVVFQFYNSVPTP